MSAPDDHGTMVSVAVFPHLCSTEAEIRLTTKPFLQRWKRKDFAEKIFTGPQRYRDTFYRNIMKLTLPFHC